MSQQMGGKDKKEDFFFGDDVYVSSDNSENDNNEKSLLSKETKIRHQVNKKASGLKKNYISNIFEWLDVVVASVVVVVIIFTFVFRMVAIDGDSMNNTLINGERVIITNMFYEPKRGDIVVISRNTKNSSVAGSYKQPIIKRIIATEGDIVDIDFELGHVYVNNQMLEESYIKEPTFTKGDVEFPLVVKENCVFVLGDNRNNSSDSRSSQMGDNGQIDVKYILGHAVLRIFPLNKFGGIY